MKVLLVDDTLTERLILVSYLKKMGHEVITGTNGEEAVTLFQEQTPDLVLLDVIMPVLDGYSATRRIRGLGGEWIPIIFLSAKNNPADIAEGINAGGDDYLTKPINHMVLTAKMQAMQRIGAMRKNLLDISSELEEANKKLLRLANMDGLTGLANRRHLDQVLDQEIRRMARSRKHISFIMADIDYFKIYNDHFGHLSGDDCLKTVAATLQKIPGRPADLVARYGGEEFCVILPETDLQNGFAIAEKLRDAVESLHITQAPGVKSGHITVSFGVASCVPEVGYSPATLVKEADRALYKAKRDGRNQVQSS
jgi:diguanylate cyclase (GGDEF)-like protein